MWSSNPGHNISKQNWWDYCVNFFFVFELDCSGKSLGDFLLPSSLHTHHVCSLSFRESGWTESVLFVYSFLVHWVCDNWMLTVNSFQVDLTFNTPSGSFSAPTHHFILDVIVGALFEEIGLLHSVKRFLVENYNFISFICWHHCICFTLTYSICKICKGMLHKFWASETNALSFTLH